MRTAAKIFSGIALIANIIIFAVFFQDGFVFQDVYLLIVSTLIGISALIELGNENKKPALAISILTLILFSPIAGIFMLCVAESTSGSTKKCKASHQPIPNYCDKCGMEHIYLKSYSTETYSGKKVQYLCPECIALMNAREKTNKESF